MLLKKMTKIKAAYADKAMGIRFLKDLGFEKPTVKQEGDDRISFHYDQYNPDGLDSVLGKHEEKNGNQYWKFGTDGIIIVKPRSRIAVLRNSKRKGTVKTVEPISDVKKELPFVQKLVKVPVSKGPDIKQPGSLRLPKSYLDKVNQSPMGPTLPTHITPTKHEPLNIPGLPPKPDLKPLQSPNIPGSKMNEDGGVPHIEIPERLQLEYAYAQRIDNPAYRIKFMNNLWTYFNSAKFGGKLHKPKSIQLMPNTRNGNNLRTRGRWYPSHRILEMAPRTFNAHMEFFAEIFLHEMCHQAVTDVNKERSNEDGGHGPSWQTWMRHVGLNPRRYDPNPNEVYMDHRELKNDPGALLRKKARSYHGIPLQTGQQVTYVWKDPATNKGKPIRNGRILGIVKGLWLILDEDLKSNSLLRVASNRIFPYQGSKKPHDTETDFKHYLNLWKLQEDFKEVEVPTTID